VVISIVQTIITSPGAIPLNKEWDVITSEAESEEDSRS
jgi:hypothetical protein